MPTLDALVRNGTYRRAQGEYVLACNFDGVFSPPLADFLALQQLQTDTFYMTSLRFSTEDPAQTLQRPIGEAAAVVAIQALNSTRFRGTWGKR
eukprot:4059770-Amphidinium_carterae.2